MTKTKKNKNKNEVLQETEDYQMQLGKPLRPVSDDLALCYQLKNTKTDVIEMETTVMSEAYGFLEQLQATLNTYRMKEKQASLVPLEIVVPENASVN